MWRAPTTMSMSLPLYQWVKHAIVKHPGLQRQKTIKNWQHATRDWKRQSVLWITTAFLLLFVSPFVMTPIAYFRKQTCIQYIYLYAISVVKSETPVVLIFLCTNWENMRKSVQSNLPSYSLLSILSSRHFGWSTRFNCFHELPLLPRLSGELFVHVAYTTTAILEGTARQTWKAEIRRQLNPSKSTNYREYWKSKKRGTPQMYRFTQRKYTRRGPAFPQDMTENQAPLDHTHSPQHTKQADSKFSDGPRRQTNRHRHFIILPILIRCSTAQTTWTANVHDQLGNSCLNGYYSTTYFRALEASPRRGWKTRGEA